MANKEFATTENEEEFQLESEAVTRLSGWRIERNSNGFYRYRWQLREGDGSPIKHITSSGDIGYGRGSKYLPRIQAIEEIRQNGKKRSK